MAAIGDAKSDQFEDDELIPAEKKESDLNASEKMEEEEDFDDNNLPEKTRHPLGTSCKLFPLHNWVGPCLYFLYIVLAILLPNFGTLLIICGNWSDTGYFSLFTILNYSWPKHKQEDPNYTAISLLLLPGEFGHQVDILSKRQDHPQLACWISDFLFWFFALYAIIVYHKLLWYFLFILFLIITKVLSRVRRPWDRQAWVGAPYANLLTMSSARGRCQFSTKITIYFETLYLGERRDGAV